MVSKQRRARAKTCLPSEVLLDIFCCVPQHAVHKAQRICHAWGEVVRANFHSFPPISLEQLRTHKSIKWDLFAKSADDLLRSKYRIELFPASIAPSRTFKHHIRLDTLEVRRDIRALHRIAEWPNRAGNMKSIELVAIRIDLDTLELLCDLVDPQYGLQAEEVVRYLAEVYPVEIYVLRHFDNAKFLNAFLRSSAAKNAALLCLQGTSWLKDGFRYAKGTFDSAIMDYCFAETKKPARIAEIGEIRAGPRLVERIIEKYQSCHDVRRFPASLTLVLRIFPKFDPRRCTMDDVAEYFPSCARLIPLQFFYAGVEYNAFVVEHAFTHERLSIRVCFDDGTLNVRFKRLKRHHTIQDVIA
ncbi:hypothetical protein AAVH_16972 [Aphelenchoides avenae]|nr:hypothetical protein AAVH_16972 [Aphelenchus avenae]